MDEIKLVSSAKIKLVSHVAIFSIERTRREARAEMATCDEVSLAAEIKRDLFLEIKRDLKSD